MFSSLDHRLGTQLDTQCANRCVRRLEAYPQASLSTRLTSNLQVGKLDGDAPSLLLDDVRPRATCMRSDLHTYISSNLLADRRICGGADLLAQPHTCSFANPLKSVTPASLTSLVAGVKNSWRPRFGDTLAVRLCNHMDAETSLNKGFSRHVRLGIHSRKRTLVSTSQGLSVGMLIKVLPRQCIHQLPGMSHSQDTDFPPSLQLHIAHCMSASSLACRKLTFLPSLGPQLVTQIARGLISGVLLRRAPRLCTSLAVDMTVRLLLSMFPNWRIADLPHPSAGACFNRRASTGPLNGACLAQSRATSRCAKHGAYRPAGRVPQWSRSVAKGLRASLGTNHVASGVPGKFINAYPYQSPCDD